MRDRTKAMDFKIIHQNNITNLLNARTAGPRRSSQTLGTSIKGLSSTLLQAQFSAEITLIRPKVLQLC